MPIAPIDTAEHRVELLDDKSSCLLCGDPTHTGPCYDDTKDDELNAIIALKCACFILLMCGTVMLVVSSGVALTGGTWRFVLAASASGILPFLAGAFGLASDAHISDTQNMLFAVFSTLCVFGIIFHVVLAMLLLTDPEGMKSALLSTKCPAGVQCGSEVTIAEDTYDDYEEVLLFSCLILAGFEVLASIAAWKLTGLQPAAVVETVSDAETLECEAYSPPQIRYAAVAHMMMDDNIQITAFGTLEEIVQGHTPPIEDLGTVANRIAMRCLDQGAQGLYGVQNQKLQVFSCKDIPSSRQDANTRYPQQFLVCWVDLTGDPAHQSTVGGLSTSISRVCFGNCDSVGAKALAFVVVYDKDFPRHDAAHFLFASMHEPHLCCAAGKWNIPDRNETLLRVGAAARQVTKKGTRRSPREEQQLVLAVERLRGENIEGMVDRTMARSLAQQEWNAVKAKHEAAVKRQFNRNMAMKETQGGCPIM